MKLSNIGNLTIVITLIISTILSQFIPGCDTLAFVLGLFIMPTYQLLTGLIWLGDSAGNKEIRYYFRGVLVYIFLIFCFSYLHNFFDDQELIENILSMFGIPIPIILALYFTYILNQHSKDKHLNP